ncbi:YjaG family protein [Dasania sp. GY-MA-18]|uniref:YjaG family protein n=1 Tax=Dasania phycosphaerae TaxID=2950436 RepID=A0A9J6RIK2_9GAMM|nr:MULTISPECIES: YjaG family protein [Dasania]MCR8921749.1 YjaG family protein [Dasania sp. GY-MA-18]MCZ0864177.1 YjaG family protein [Dasania phycosphaerae]MCZ0867905.1 YjaG family protein [Dasania phycosphaerae]
MKFENLLATSWRDIAYCTALLERMYPNYCLFSELTESGDAKVLRNGLDTLWASCAGHEQTVDFNKQLEKLEPVMPDSENCEFFGVRPAADACVALAMLFDCCAGNQPLETEAFEKLYCSTIMAYLEFVQPELNAEQAQQHELMVDAEAYFAELRQRLAEDALPQKDSVKALKSFAGSIAVSNIGIATQ